MLALCQHNTLAYYAFYYAGIFDAGLASEKGVAVITSGLTVVVMIGSRLSGVMKSSELTVVVVTV